MLDVRVSVWWWWWSLIVCIYMWMSVYSLHATRFPSIASVHCVLKVLFISFCPCSDRMNWEVGEERRYLHWKKKQWSFKNINAIALVHAMMIYTTAWSAYNVYRGDSVDSILTVFSSFIYIVFCAQVNQ